VRMKRSLSMEFEPHLGRSRDLSISGGRYWDDVLYKIAAMLGGVPDRKTQA